RHRSVLDVLSKMQEASARVQRAVAKAVTVCGCIRIEASCQALSDVTSEDVSYADLKQFVQSHVAGQLCHNCRDVIEVELGQAYFYTTALAATFNMRAADVLAKEQHRLVTLAVFNPACPPSAGAAGSGVSFQPPGCAARRCLRSLSPPRRRARGTPAAPGPRPRPPACPS